MTRYEIVPDESHVWIDARSSVHPIHVEVDGLEGHVEVESNGEGLTLAAGSHVQVAVERLESGNPLVDLETKRRVDVRRHPRIAGEATAVEVSDNGSLRMTGDLTFRGVTTTVTGNVTLAVDGDDVVVEGEQQFDVRDWGMEPPRLLLLKVEPIVSVRIRVRARKAN